MPIYRRTYRSFDGAAPGRLRWLVIVKQELRVLVASRPFLLILGLGYLHVLIRALQIIVSDTLLRSVPGPLINELNNFAAMDVNSTMFLDFLRVQTGLVFLTSIYAGAGMICEDFQNNLTEVYFSKPMTWIDYVFGKAVALALVGLVFTAVPGVAMVLLHNSMAPGLETIEATWWWPFSITLFSLVVVMPCTLGVLASSSLMKSSRYASIAIFMILFGDLVIGRNLPFLLHNPRWAILAFPLALNRIGEALFQERRILFRLSLNWALVYFAVVCVVALVIVCVKARRAEVAS